MFLLFKFVMLTSVINVYSSKVLLLGDSITMNLKKNNFNLFDDSDTIYNHAYSAFGIDLVSTIIDPNRNNNELFTLLQNNQYTIGYDINEIIPNIYPNPPNIISIMVGIRDIFDGFISGDNNVDKHINKYKLLLNKLEYLVPLTTIIYINSVLPTTNDLLPGFLKESILTEIELFNDKLKTEIDTRDRFTYIDLFELFMKDGYIDRSLFFYENYEILHPNINGYTVWKNKITYENNHKYINTTSLIINTDNVNNRVKYISVFIDNIYISGSMTNNQLINIVNKNFQKIEIKLLIL